MPKGISMLVKQMAKQIPEDTIDETINGIMDWLSNAFVALENILKDDDVIDVQAIEPQPENKQLQA